MNVRCIVNESHPLHSWIGEILYFEPKENIDHALRTFNQGLKEEHQGHNISKRWGLVLFCNTRYNLHVIQCQMNSYIDIYIYIYMLNSYSKRELWHVRELDLIVPRSTQHVQLVEVCYNVVTKVPLLSNIV